MRRNFLILITWGFTILSHGGGTTNKFTIAVMKECTLYSTHALDMDNSSGFTNNFVMKVFTKETPCHNKQQIFNSIEGCYTNGVARPRKWGDWWDYAYANKYWGVFDAHGNAVYLLCFFNKDKCVQQTNSFWGVTGLRDMNYFGERTPPGCDIYQIMASDQWNGTFESKTLEQLLIKGSVDTE